MLPIDTAIAMVLSGVAAQLLQKLYSLSGDDVSRRVPVGATLLAVLALLVAFVRASRQPYRHLRTITTR
jgi:hypothetical protein